MLRKLIAGCLTLSMFWLQLCNANAAVFLENFESGLDPATNGWTKIGGDSAAVGSVAGNLPIGSFQGQLANTGNVATDAAIQSALGLSATALDDLIGGGSTTKAFDGTAMSRTLSFDVGDVLSFRWSFVTNEITPPTGIDPNDFSFVYFSGASGSQLELLGRADATIASTEGTFARRTIEVVKTYAAITTPGTYTLAFGVMNYDTGVSFLGNSALLLDNVRVVAVPEPSSFALLGLAGSVLGFRRRQRNR